MYLNNLNAALGELGGVVYDMERRGVPVDRDVLADIRGRAARDAHATAARLRGYLGIARPAQNWNYAAWLAGVLYDTLGLPVSPYTSKGLAEPGKRPTDARALEWLAATNPEHRPFLNDLRKLRRQARVVNYADTWLDLAVPHPDGTWRLHPSYGMAGDEDTRPGARTGRFGIKNPALQQVPRDHRKDPYGLRRAFVAPPGYRLLVADYSQLEVVIMAHLIAVLFGSRRLADRLEPGAPDLHSATAKYVYGEILGNADVAACPVGDLKGDPRLGLFRDQIKAVRYGFAYCKSARSFGDTLFELDSAGEICGPPLGEARAAELVNGLVAFDPECREYQEWVRRYVSEHGAIPTLAGRWAPLPGARSSSRSERNRAWRQACNWPMQGGGQEITGAAMVELARRGYAMTLQVHDEIHALVPEDRADAAATEMAAVMSDAWPLRARLTAKPKHGTNWMETK